jgi:hypothetical protein
VQLTTGTFKLAVKGISGDASAASAVASVQNKSDIKLLGKDIRFIKTLPLSYISNGNFYGSWKYYLLLIAPFTLLIGAALYKRRLDALTGNVAYRRSAKATRMAQKRLSAAKKLLDENKQEPFYEEVFKTLYGYSSDKLGINLSELSKENLRATLTSRNVKDETLSKLFATIDTCEFARFASQMNGADSKQVYDNSVQIITELENQL